MVQKSVRTKIETACSECFEIRICAILKICCDGIADSIAPVHETESSPIDMTSSLKSLKLLAIGFCGAAIALSSGLSTAAQAQMPDDAAAPAEQLAQGAPSIVDIAVNAGSFDTLVAALQAAELVETLSGEGPFTVFAPIDEAFAALPDGVLEALLEPGNKDLLTQILTYHVVSGGVLSSDLTSGEVTALGGDLTVDVSDAGVMVNSAQVLQADIEGSNGVIHVIDQVLVPEAVATELASRLAAAEDAEPMAEPMAEEPMMEPVAAEEPMMAEMEEPEFSEPAPVSEPVRGLW